MIIIQCYLCRKYKIGNRWENKIETHEDVELSHGLCPKCVKIEKERIMNELKQVGLA